MRYRGLMMAGLCLLLSLTSFVQADRRSDATMKRAPVEGGQLEYETRGDGEPVLLIHGGVIAASYVPVMREPALGRYRLIRYHRRGYAGSTKHEPGASFSIAKQAADAVALLRHLGIERAHIVGHSYGGVIALQLALDAPRVVHSLTLLEPAIVQFVPSGAEFGKQTMESAMARYRTGDHAGAVDAFMRVVVAPNWKSDLARTIPGGPEQAERDVRTMFEVETPALGEWEFDTQKAQTISQPILHVVGSESLAIFHEGGRVLHSWFPQQVEDLTVPGVAHGLHQMGGRYSVAVAQGIATFLRRHPIAETHKNPSLK
jgi:pimeloyl-ACP methyl ester carboxylesterase